MIHKSNPYNVKPLPGIGYFSFGRFGKGSRGFIAKNRGYEKPIKFKARRKTTKGMVKWGEPVTIKILRWKREKGTNI